jgi:deoxyribonuclease V
MQYLYENITLDEARAMQKELAQLVITKDQFANPITYVAGVDVGYNLRTNEQTAAAVLMNVHTRTVEQIVTATTPTFLPYIPGFLSFREIPTILEALKKLTTKPDLILCDGQGIAHPRGLGIASHLGVLLDMPTLGCGKSLLVGRAEEPALEKGSQTPLIYRKKQIGVAVRTRAKVKPVYVSPGHRICQETAVAWILAFATRYRLPEPIHIADRTVKNATHTENKHI